MTAFSKFILVFLVSTLVISCTSEPEDNFVLRGSIKGLKKGIVYLQKDGDSSIITIDSMVIKGEPEFQLSTSLEEPMVLYLKLFKNDGEEHFIPFFADLGETYLTTSLDNFNFDVKIKGSEQQAILEEYLKVMSKYNETNLELIKENFLAQKDNDTTRLDSIRIESDRLFKRKYAYTINFALNHSNSEVAPYLALYEIPNTSRKFVDSIYSKLDENIKNSFYGRKLNAVLTAKDSATTK
jgi:hypothetical protein